MPTPNSMSMPTSISFESIVNIHNNINNYVDVNANANANANSCINQNVSSSNQNQSQQHSTFVYQDQTRILTAKTTGNHQCQITLFVKPQQHQQQQHRQQQQQQQEKGKKRKKRKRSFEESVFASLPTLTPTTTPTPTASSQWEQKYQKFISFPKKKSFSILALSFASTYVHPLNDNTTSNTTTSSSNDNDHDNNNNNNNNNNINTHTNDSNSNNENVNDVDEEPCLFLLTKNGGLYYTIFSQKPYDKSTNTSNRDEGQELELELELDIISCSRYNYNQSDDDNNHHHHHHHHHGEKMTRENSNTSERRRSNPSQQKQHQHQYHHDPFLLGMNFMSIKLHPNQGMNMYNNNSNNNTNHNTNQIDKRNGKGKGITMAVAGSMTLNPPMIIYIPIRQYNDLSQSFHSTRMTRSTSTSRSTSKLWTKNTKQIYTIDIPGLDHVDSPITSIQLMDKDIFDCHTWFGLQSLWDHGYHNNIDNSGGNSTSSSSSSTHKSKTCNNHYNLWETSKWSHCPNTSVIIMGFEDGSIYLSFVIVSYEMNTMSHLELEPTPAPAPVLEVSCARLVHKMDTPIQSIVSTCLVPTQITTTTQSSSSSRSNSSNGGIMEENKEENSNITTTTTLVCIGSLGSIAVLVTPPPPPPPHISYMSSMLPPAKKNTNSLSTMKTTVVQKRKLPSFQTIICSHANTTTTFLNNTTSIGIIRSAAPIPPNIITTGIDNNSRKSSTSNDSGLLSYNNDNDTIMNRFGNNDVTANNTSKDRSITTRHHSLSVVVTSGDCSTHEIYISILTEQKQNDKLSSLVSSASSSTLPHDYYKTKGKYDDIVSVPQIRSIVRKLPIRKEMKYVSSAWTLQAPLLPPSELVSSSSSLMNDYGSSLFLTLVTVRNSMLILVPLNISTRHNKNCSSTYNTSFRKKSKLNKNVVGFDKSYSSNVTKTSSSSSKSCYHKTKNDEEINHMFDLFHKLSSPKEESGQTTNTKRIKNQRNILINEEICKSRRSSSIVSLMLSQTQNDDHNDNGEKSSCGKHASFVTDIIDPNMVSIRATQSLQLPASKALEDGTNDESFTLHVFESIPISYTTTASPIVDQLHILGERNLQRNKVSYIPTNVYYAGNAQSSNYPTLSGTVENGINVHRWDNFPLQSFTSMSIPFKNEAFVEEEPKKRKISTANFLQRDREMKVKRVKVGFFPLTTIQPCKARTYECLGISAHIKTVDIGCIDLLRLFESKHVDCPSTSIDKVSSILLSSINDPNLLVSPKNREEKLIGFKTPNGAEYSQQRPFIASVVHPFVSLPLIKYTMFSTRKCLVLDPSTINNAMCLKLIMTNKESDNKACSVDFAVTGCTRIEIESILKLFESSLKMRIFHLHTNASFSNENKQHELESEFTLNMYKKSLDDENSIKTVARLKKLLNRVCCDVTLQPSVQLVMELIKKLRTIEVLRN